MPHTDKEKAAACKRRYYDKNRQECIDRARQWRIDNRDYYNEWCRNRKAKNREFFREYDAERMRVWRKNNPDKVHHAVKEQRAKRKLAPGHHTLQQWMWRVEYYGWKCFYCKRKMNYITLTQEHLIPLSKGGTHWASNLVPACRSCNSSKGSKKLKY